jgi:hypothetical protein
MSIVESQNGQYWSRHLHYERKTSGDKVCTSAHSDHVSKERNANTWMLIYTQVDMKENRLEIYPPEKDKTK